LESASNGIYELRQLESLPDSWKRSYFTKVDENRYKVSDYIRNQVIFRRLNLMDSQFPFQQGFNVIFCRNVMIYFDKETTFNLVNKFYELTKPGGYLLISHTESLNRDKTNYRYIQPGVYRKI
jgi:chemotaxis protein methyltransferase CheR